MMFEGLPLVVSGFGILKLLNFSNIFLGICIDFYGQLYLLAVKDTQKNRHPSKWRSVSSRS